MQIQVRDIAAVLRRMAKLKNVRAVQEQAFIALVEFSLYATSDEVTRQKGAIEAVVNGMHAYINDSEIQRLGCIFVSNFVRRGGNSLAVMRDKGGIDAVVNAMNAHRNDSRVQESACLALARLAVNDDNLAVIRNKGGIDAILSGMNAHRTVSEVQEQSCWALFGLSRDAENKATIRDKGGIDAIRNAMDAHRHTFRIYMQEKNHAALMELAAPAGKRIDTGQTACMDALAGAIDVQQTPPAQHPLQNKDRQTAPDLTDHSSKHAHATQRTSTPDVCAAAVTLHTGGKELDKKKGKADRKDRNRVGNSTCTGCGKTAAEAGLKRLLACSACTIAPEYCGLECQLACWGTHRAECRENKQKREVD